MEQCQNFLVFKSANQGIDNPLVPKNRYSVPQIVQISTKIVYFTKDLQRPFDIWPLVMAVF